MGGGGVGVGSDGCDPRIEAIVKLKSRWGDWVGSDGCELRIEDIKKVGVGVVGFSRGSGRGGVGRGFDEC